MKWLIGVLLYMLTTSTYSAEVKSPLVSMKTNFGTIIIELNQTKAPKTVANFLRYTREGFYDGTIFHRVIDDFMIQGGGFTQKYQQKETHEPINNEADNGLKNVRGTIAMARTNDPHSATAQFFINVKDNHFLDYTSSTPRGWGYTVFGKVIEGMEIVDKIKKVPTGSGGPFPTDVPQSPVIIEKLYVVDDSVTESTTPVNQPKKDSSK
ncbi:peptidyl-prolyl cis-trans isomerase B [Thioploca ingrica]|uniref:Peptidyl-prolyl cis-trans isomerase n=1 Tax=Thioploca ingrica TaxID=40754 RepID=A0A090AAW2_9GAMM|nr:peptidyl-prolyl cis-trans isomerase B [Thioploca ingrica]